MQPLKFVLCVNSIKKLKLKQSRDLTIFNFEKLNMQTTQQTSAKSLRQYPSSDKYKAAKCHNLNVGTLQQSDDVTFFSLVLSFVWRDMKLHSG
jgi:hypothetical protein